ncbi:MAG TPA: peptidyl-prolyl cis-trans isomerase [Acidobacteriota bacterium]|nr:peptidyl-prolyl cis-trans isomerase [Acidobacteriota bacterium]
MGILRFVVAAACLFAFLLSMSGCAPTLSLSEESVARLQDKPLALAAGEPVLTASDFYSRLSQSTLLMSGGTVEKERTNYLLDSILVDTLAGLEANEIDLGSYPLPLSTFRRQYYDFLLYAYWNETVYKKTTGDSLEAIAYYYDHAELFSVEEQVNLYHILISPRALTLGADSAYYKPLPQEELWQIVQEQADKLWRLLNWGAPFENVAFDFSHDGSSRQAGGYMGWTPREQYIDPFDSVAFSLKIGEHSYPYRDKDGYHIIYIDGYLPDGLVPIDSPQVYASAMETLLTDKSNQVLLARLDSLRAEINVLPNESIMDANIHLVDDFEWAGVVNGRDTIYCRYLKQFEEAARREYNVDNSTREIKLEMLKKAAERYIQVQAARANGIDTLPYVAAEERRLRHFRKKTIVMTWGFDYSWRPADSVLEAYYYDHIDEYSIAKPYKLQSVVTRDSVLAAFLRDQVESGVDAGDLVREYRGRGGIRVRLVDHGYVGESDLSPEVLQAARSTPVGSVSPVMGSESGDYRFIRVQDRKRSRTIEFARGDILVKLQKDHARMVWENFRDRLYRKYNVTFPVRVSQIQLGNYHTRNPGQ